MNVNIASGLSLANEVHISFLKNRFKKEFSQLYFTRSSGGPAHVFA